MFVMKLKYLFLSVVFNIYFVNITGYIHIYDGLRRRRPLEYHDCQTNDKSPYCKEEYKRKKFPLIINTWNYTVPTEEAWRAAHYNISHIDVLVAGISVCEFDPAKCDFQVGFGGNPDETGETTLDAMLMDGVTMNTGGVGDLRRIKNAVGVAKHVLLNTNHSLIVGEKATEFAKKFGFPEESLITSDSLMEIHEWEKNGCQPNFWVNKKPEEMMCSPKLSKYSLLRKYSNYVNDYRPLYKHWPSNCSQSSNLRKDYINVKRSHDTITMLYINQFGHIAAGSSTNGLNHKIEGRVGDSPIAGSGVYADATAGAAIATGNGDIMQRFSPSFLAVEQIRRGASPRDAAYTAVERIAYYYPNFWGAIVAADMNGNFGAACSGMDRFPFSVINNEIGQVTVFSVTCI